MTPSDEEPTEELSDRPKDRTGFQRRPLLKALSAGAALTVSGGTAAAKHGKGHGKEPEVTLEVLAGHANFPDDVSMKLAVKYEDGANERISVNDASNTLVVKGTFDPGAMTGWHVDNGPVIVNVAEGTVKVTFEDKPECETHTYEAGEAFAATGKRPDNVENPSDTDDAVIFATFFDIANDEGPSSPVEDPDC